MRILSLDGGGAKGFYTLGVLREVEAAYGGRLCDAFDLVYGTSTGSIIASLIALGKSVSEITDLYERRVVGVVSATLSRAKSAALSRLADEVFDDLRFDAFVTGIGIVATRWETERPLIFKNEVSRAARLRSTFDAGFGCRISDAVQASCSAYPFFQRKWIETSTGDKIELIDGGYCANNPALFAIADAVAILGKRTCELQVLSIGVGTYPEKRKGIVKGAINSLLSVRLLQKTLEINTKSMEQLNSILFDDLSLVRVSDTFSEPHMATDLFESDLGKLNTLKQKGSASFALREAEIRSILGVS